MSSSLPGLTSQNKGDKKKYQSININSVYKGKGAEAQKSSVQRQHGMQSLGKVATVRRMPPPINLPSLKSENSGNDPTVNLVPSGPASTGWGTGKSSTTSEGQQQSAPQSRPQQGSMLGSGTVRSGATRTETAPATTGGSGVGTVSQAQPKTWSSVTGRGAAMFDQERPPPPAGAGKESVRFAREFPSLDGTAQTAGAGGKPGTSTALDLRPQNVGSWRDGGGKNITSDHQAADDEGPTGSASQPADQQRGRDSDDEEQRDNYRSSSYNGRMYNQKSMGATSTGEDRLFKRPTIVKDKDIEELGHKAASRANNEESSWATATDDIDYSVKLVFSDDEDESHTAAASKSTSRDKRSAPADSTARPSDRGRSPDKASQSEHRPTGGGYRQGEGERDRPREAWGPHQHQYSGGYPPQGPMMHQQRMPYDMWQRGQPAGGKAPPPNMPPSGPYGYRMPYPGPGGMNRPPPGRQTSGDDDDDDLWSRKQKRTNKEVNAAVERAMSKRGEESDEQRRSRSASESSSSEQVSRPRGSNNENKRPQAQIPPRFQQQRSRERSPDRGGPRGEEGRPYYPPHQPPTKQGGQQQPPWTMPWPGPPPPPHYMPGMPMPPRPRNNSRGSDDDRRTPDQQNYKQFYEYQMAQWMHMMSEYAKANPDVPLPPLPPFVPPPRGVTAGGVPPPTSDSGSGRPLERKPTDTQSDRDSQADTKTADQRTNQDTKPTGEHSADSKVQVDPFEEPAAASKSDTVKATADDSRKYSNSSSRDDSKQSAYRSHHRGGDRRDEREHRDRRDDRRGPKAEGKPQRHQEHDGHRPPRQGKHREELDNKESAGMEGRKRRSDMTAPPPVVKETLRADTDRQRQMVTLKRASKKGEESKSKPAADGTSSSLAAADKSQDKKSTKTDSQPASSDAAKSVVPPPKQSAWGPTPIPQPISIGVEEARIKSGVSVKSEKENVAPAADDLPKEVKEERAKDSPDTDKPPVKRVKEEQASRSSYGRNARGGSGQHPSERGARRGARTREFVRGGGSASRGGGSSRGGGYSAGGRGSRSLSGRGSSRGRGYDSRFSSRDYRGDDYTQEDWDSERVHPSSRKDSKSTADPGSTDAAKATGESDKSSDKPAAVADTKPTTGSKPASGAKEEEGEGKVEIPPLLSQAPPPKENVWDKRKQERNMRETPSPPTTGDGTSDDKPSVSVDRPETKATESAAKDAEGGEEKPAHARKDDNTSSRRGRGRARPTRDTYVVPGARSKGSSYHNRQSSRQDHYYDEEYDDGYEESGHGRYGGRGRGRSRGGYNSSSRGRYGESRSAPRSNKDEGGDNAPTIDQWNGPPEDMGRDYAPPSGGRGRGRGRGGRYPTRGGSRGGGRGPRAHPILPSAAHSPSKRRQDSTNTDNDPQEEWETASESSDHLKDSAGASQSTGSNANKGSERRDETSGGAPHSRSNGSSTFRGGARGQGERSSRGRSERGRGRGERSRGGYRSNRDDRYSKEKSPDDKPSTSSSRGRGGKSYNSGRASGATNGAVYKLDSVTLDNPSAAASALSNKNSELSDVSKPLSNKEKSSKASAKEPVQPVADPLDGYDLNNYAGVVIIDEMGGNKEDSDGWQDEDGFQEVISRKTRKEKQRQEQEAAAKALLASDQAKRKALALEKKRASQRSSSPPLRAGRKNKLPPRFRKQEEEKHRLDNFKIEKWDADMMNGAASRPGVAEAPVQIGSWDQHMASVSAAPAPTTTSTTTSSTATTSTTATATTISTQPATTSVVMGDNATLSVAAQSKPADKGGEQHDSGIDVGNDKDTSSVRSSPDAGSLPMRQSMVPSQHSPFSATLSTSQQDNNPTPTTNRSAPSVVAPLSSAGAPPGGSMKMDFNFDPKLAEQHSTAASAPVALNASKIQSMKSLWGEQGSVIFGTSQAAEPATYHPKSTEVYEQVEIVTAVDAFQSSADGFTASPEGYRPDTFPDNTSYLPSSSQSNSSIFVSPTAQEQQQQNSSVLGSSRQQQQQQSPAAVKLMSPRSAGNATGTVGGVPTTSSSSTHSVLDGSASAFTPSYQYNSKGGSERGASASVPALPTSQSPQGFTNFMNPMVGQQGQHDAYQVYRSQSLPQQGLTQAVQQQASVAQVGGALHQTQPVFTAQTQQQQHTYQQNVGAASSQGYPQLLVGTSSVTSPMVKQSTAAFSQSKLGQFDSSSNTSTPQPHQQLSFMPPFELQGMVGAGNAQQGYRLTPAQATAPQAQSSYFTQSGMNYFPSPASSLHSTVSGSNFALGAVQNPQPPTLVIGMPSSNWTQQPSHSQLKSYKPSGATAAVAVPNQLSTGVPLTNQLGSGVPVANQMKAQQQLVNPQAVAVVAAARTSQASFQMPAGGGGVFSSGQPSATGTEYLAAHNLSSTAQSKWVTSTNQQEKQMMAGAGQVMTPNQMSASAKMGGANMMAAGKSMNQQMQQMQKPMQNVKPAYAVSPQAQAPRQGFAGPRPHLPTGPTPLMHSVMGQQPQPHRHTANQPRTQYPQSAAMGRAGAPHSNIRYPAPIQRPAAQSRQSNRSSKTPPTSTHSLSTKGPASGAKGVSAGESKYVTEDQMSKERLSTINAIKNFCNPDKAAGAATERDSAASGQASGDQPSPPPAAPSAAAEPTAPPPPAPAAPAASNTDTESAAAPSAGGDEQ